TFSWPAPTQTNVIGGSAGSGSSISQTLSDASGLPGSAVYTITPVAGGCNGSSLMVTVGVYHPPVSTYSSQSVCSGQTTSISITADIPSTTFSWPAPTMTNATGGATGSGSAIIQKLTSTSSSVAGQVV